LIAHRIAEALDIMMTRILWPLLLLLLLLIASAAVPAGAADIRHGDEPWVDPGWRRTVARYAITFDEQGLSNRNCADVMGRAARETLIGANPLLKVLTVSDLTKWELQYWPFASRRLDEARG
jgi:hypothetical protein